jgi:hypothetical protein
VSINLLTPPFLYELNVYVKLAIGVGTIFVLMVLLMLFISDSDHFPLNIIPDWKNRATKRRVAFDLLRHKYYEDALESVSRGAGIKPPPLVVADLDLPIAWARYNSHAKKKACEEISQTWSVVIAKGLLEEPNLNGPEREAICANLLSKLLFPFPDGSKELHHLAIEGGFNECMYRFIDEKTPAYKTYVRKLLLEDAWAARLINNPVALRSAIKKSFELLKDSPNDRGFLDPMIFVTPPPLSANYKDPTEPKSRTSRSKVDRRLQGATAVEQITELRIESLKLIETGARQPYETVLEGKPVTHPKGVAVAI